MKYLKKLFVTLAFAVLIAAPVVTVTVAPTTYAVVTGAGGAGTAGPSCEVGGFLGIPPWYRGLTSNDGQCSIDPPSGDKDALSKFILHIALNLIEIGLYIVGYIAVFFVLYGGFQFLTGGSNPSQIEKARKTILNAVVGLVISISAVVIVNLLFGITVK
jgi:hypothetical protein